jgi:hypothetical protein
LALEAQAGQEVMESAGKVGTQHLVLFLLDMAVVVPLILLVVRAVAVEAYFLLAAVVVLALHLSKHQPTRKELEE